MTPFQKRIEALVGLYLLIGVVIVGTQFLLGAPCDAAAGERNKLRSEMASFYGIVGWGAHAHYEIWKHGMEPMRFLAPDVCTSGD